MLFQKQPANMDRISSAVHKQTNGRNLKPTSYADKAI